MIYQFYECFQLGLFERVIVSIRKAQDEYFILLAARAQE